MKLNKQSSYQKKKEVRDKNYKKNVSRRLKGQAKKAWENSEEEIDNNGIHFASFKEDKSYMIYPRTNNGNFALDFKELNNVYCYIMGTLRLFCSGNPKRLIGSLCVCFIPTDTSYLYFKAENIWTHDFTDRINEFTINNCHTIFQEESSKFCKVMKKWNFEEFLDICLTNSDKGPEAAADVIYSNLNSKNVDIVKIEELLRKYAKIKTKKKKYYL